MALVFYTMSLRLLHGSGAYIPAPGEGLCPCLCQVSNLTADPPCRARSAVRKAKRAVMLCAPSGGDVAEEEEGTGLGKDVLLLHNWHAPTGSGALETH